MVDLVGFKIGPYTIVKTLPHGTTADCFLALDEKGRTVVVKRLFSDLTEDTRVVDMFLNSLNLSAKIKIGRHVAKTISTKKLPEGVFLLREHVDGYPLADFISGNRHADFDLHRAGLDICDAIRALSRPGIVHGGLHPDNLIVQRDGRIKITDYGTSLLTLTGKLSVDYPLNALRYLSPEQVNGEEATSRSDIYSVGMVIWALNNRRDNVDASDFCGITRQIRAGLNPKSHIIAAAVHKDPKRRYSTIDDLRARLHKVQPSGPTTTGDTEANPTIGNTQPESRPRSATDTERRSNADTETTSDGSTTHNEKALVDKPKPELGESPDTPTPKETRTAESEIKNHDEWHQPPVKPEAIKKFGRLTATYDVVGKIELLESGRPKPLHISSPGTVQRPLQLTNGGEASLDLTAKCFGNGVHASPERVNIAAGKMASVIVSVEATTQFAKLQLSWNEKDARSVVVQIVRCP